MEFNEMNKIITEYENLYGVKSIFESIQQFPSYRIGALILIGRLCILKDCDFHGHYAGTVGFALSCIQSVPVTRFLPCETEQQIFHQEMV